MDIFKQISDMKFGEAYSEIASTVYGEVKETIQERRESATESGSTPEAIIEDMRERMFG